MGAEVLGTTQAAQGPRPPLSSQGFLVQIPGLRTENETRGRDQGGTQASRQPEAARGQPQQGRTAFLPSCPQASVKVKGLTPDLPQHLSTWAVKAAPPPLSPSAQARPSPLHRALGTELRGCGVTEAGAAWGPVRP